MLEFQFGIRYFLGNFEIEHTGTAALTETILKFLFIRNAEF